MHTAYIGIGSNQGNRLEICHQAIAAVCAEAGTRLDAVSAFYETEPVGLEAQAWFINAVMRVHTDQEVWALHDGLQQIERAFGRRCDGPRFGPRVLDLDLLFYDQLVIKTDRLQVPHPRLHERRFVLRPLHDIAPGLMHPVMGRTVERLLAALTDRKGVVCVA